MTWMKILKRHSERTTHGRLFAALIPPGLRLDLEVDKAVKATPVLLQVQVTDSAGILDLSAIWLKGLAQIWRETERSSRCC